MSSLVNRLERDVGNVPKEQPILTARKIKEIHNKIRELDNIDYFIAEQNNIGRWNRSIALSIIESILKEKPNWYYQTGFLRADSTDKTITFHIPRKWRFKIKDLEEYVKK